MKWTIYLQLTSIVFFNSLIKGPYFNKVELKLNIAKDITITFCLKRIYSTKVLPEDEYFNILSIAGTAGLACWRGWVEWGGRIGTAEVWLGFGE